MNGEGRTDVFGLGRPNILPARAKPARALIAVTNLVFESKVEVVAAGLSAARDFQAFGSPGGMPDHKCHNDGERRHPEPDVIANRGIEGFGHGNIPLAPHCKSSHRMVQSLKRCQEPIY